MRIWPALLICMLCGHAEEWNRVSNEKGYPTEFGKVKNMAWRTPVRAGKSSPVLTARHIFLTAADAGKLYTQCFGRKTGRLLWERSLDRPHTEVANRLNHEAAITPVTDGENVYVFFKDFGFVSYDGSGQLRWKTPLGPFTNTQGLAASPILAGDSVILVADQWENSYIAALDRKTGQMRWKVARQETEGWGTPLLHQASSGTPRIVTVSRGQMGLHDISDGRRTASVPGLATAIVSSPVIDADILYVFGYGVEVPAPFAPRLDRLDRNKDGTLSPEEYTDDPILNNVGKNAGNRDRIVSEDEWDVFAKRVLGPNCLIAIRIEKNGARVLWRYDKNFTSVIPSTLFYRDVLYVVRNGGILTTHDASNGNVIKTARIQGALGGYSSSPVAADGKVWIASEEGKISVLRAAGEWEVLTINDLGEGCYATPALSQGVIYLRTEEALYAFESTASSARKNPALRYADRLQRQRSRSSFLPNSARPR
jgi:outer membrane protein assembly factor BamB